LIDDEQPRVEAPMPSSPLSEILPPLDETGHSREEIIELLSREIDLPSVAVAFGTAYADEIRPDVMAAVERACRQDLDPDEARLFFRGVHILGGRRFGSLFNPLITFLHGPAYRVDDLLGKAAAVTLSKILAGAYDGDPALLQSLILKKTADPLVRADALDALAFLTFDRRVERTRFERFLLRLDQVSVMPRDDEVLWHAWMTAVGVLGMESLAPRVRAAFADGRIAPEWSDEEEFDKMLAAALERPEDGTRLADQGMGYIEDVLLELEQFDYYEDNDADLYDDEVDEPAPFVGDRFPFKLQEPVRNPLRGVGRNDPCPCGSGKKAKKCCLQ
jgi:hypothetical protein